MIKFRPITAAKMEENLVSLQKGQEVLIKKPGVPVGKVIGPRPGDSGLSEEQTHYCVQIEPQYYLSRDLEPVEQHSTSARLDRYSPEWLDELKRFNEVGRQLHTNPKDRNLVAKWAESGTKLGLFIPIE